MYCPNCGARGAEGAEDARYCSSCGQPLAPQPAPPPPRTSPTLFVLLGVIVVLLVVAVGAVLYALGQRQTGRTPAAGTATEAAAPAAGTAPASSPVSAEDPVAEATVVLERYLAADLGHDGKEMAKYLGGQAAARFRPEVQGQEDLTVHSKQISGHSVRDENTIDFEVETKWSSESSGGTQTQTDTYVLQRTDRGWRIVSTPEYPQ